MVSRFAGACLPFALLVTACGGKVSDDTSDASISGDTSTRDAATPLPIPDTSVPASDTRVAVPDTTPLDTGAVDTGGPTDPPDPPPPETCGDCVTVFCKPPLAKCIAIPACNAGIECVNECLTTECRNTCISKADSPEMEDAIACVVTHCKSQCGF